MRRKSILLAALVAAICVSWAGTGSAQIVQRIAAIVNDEVISLYDLQARTRMVIFSAKLENTPEVRARIARQVLRGLVDERLQLQEAKRQNVSVSKQEIDKALARIEEQNRIPEGQLERYLSARGVPIGTVVDQIRASIAWSKLLQRSMGSRVSISAEEVQDYIDRLKSRQGQAEYRIAEILLTAESPGEATQVRRTAMRLIEQIRAGAPFAAVARQFSQSASAAVGGDLGWLHESEIEDELAGIVPNMATGQISEPIRTIGGYRIIALADKRRIGTGGQGETEVELRQIFIPLRPEAPREEARSKMALASDARRSLDSCDDVARVARAVGSTRPAALGMFAMNDLSPTIRQAVADLETGQTSAPITLDGGILVLMVCGRAEPPSALPDPEEVREMLYKRRMSRMSRRYLRDIRLAAVVDVRV